MDFKVQELLYAKTFISSIYLDMIHLSPGFEDIINRLQKEGDETTVNIKLTVDGHELPVIQTFESIEARLDNLISNEAKEMVRLKTTEKLEKIQESIKKLEEYANELIEETL